jgi:hypothetical protein
MCVLRRSCVVLNVSVNVSSGGVSASPASPIGGSVAILESKGRLLSFSYPGAIVLARMFSVRGSVAVELIMTELSVLSRIFSNVEVTVINRVFFTVPT